MSRQTKTIYPLITQLTDDVNRIAGYIEAGAYYQALNLIRISLGKLKEKDKKTHREFIEKIKDLLNFISSGRGTIWSETYKIRDRLAATVWSQDLYDSYVNVLWAGNYLDERGYGYFDSALDKQSPGKKPL